MLLWTVTICRRPQVYQCTSSRATDLQWGESGLNLYKRADFLAVPHHAHLCSEHFSERFCKHHGVPHGVCFKADTMFRYSFKILPDRLKLIRLYPCGSLRQSISSVFGAQVGHFAATPQSDVAGIWSHDLGVMAMLSVQQKMPFFVHL